MRRRRFTPTQHERPGSLSQPLLPRRRLRLRCLPAFGGRLLLGRVRLGAPRPSRATLPPRTLLRPTLRLRRVPRRSTIRSPLSRSCARLSRTRTPGSTTRRYGACFVASVLQGVLCILIRSYARDRRPWERHSSEGMLRMFATRRAFTGLRATSRSGPRPSGRRSATITSSSRAWGSSGPTRCDSRRPRGPGAPRLNATGSAALTLCSVRRRPALWTLCARRLRMLASTTSTFPAISTST